MTCAEFEIVLSDYVDGAVSVEQRREIEAHADVCPVCRELLRDVFQAVAFLEKAEEPTPPAELITRLVYHAPKGRLRDESEVFPDIVLIDGGRGQLNAALAAFRDQQVEPPAILSLAKRDEEIYLPDQEEPVRLSRHAYALRLLQYVRDEAHRFAQHYHHMLKRKTTFDE